MAVARVVTAGAAPVLRDDPADGDGRRGLAVVVACVLIGLLPYPAAVLAAYLATGAVVLLIAVPLALGGGDRPFRWGTALLGLYPYLAALGVALETTLPVHAGALAVVVAALVPSVRADVLPRLGLVLSAAALALPFAVDAGGGPRLLATLVLAGILVASLVARAPPGPPPP